MLYRSTTTTTQHSRRQNTDTTKKECINKALAHYQLTNTANNQMITDYRSVTDAYYKKGICFLMQDFTTTGESAAE